MPRLTPLFLLSLLVALTAYLVSSVLRSFLATASAAIENHTSHNPESAAMKRPRMPVYFFSHGGPDVMYNTSHPVYPVLQRIGAEITSLRPAAVVVFSAHWQSPVPTSVLVNAAPSAPLIYDFSGFPPHYYAATYPNVGSPSLAARVCALLVADGEIACSPTHRGLDHGVWAGFHVAFHPDENPLRVPLVQVSLLRGEDPDAHYRLGRAVSALRDEGVVVIGAGMSVHNLHHMGSGPEPLPYAVSFDDALKEAAEAGAHERQRKMSQLCGRPDARQAHPWMDHLIPVHVAAGAAGDDLGRQLWTMKEGSFAWAQYRFGSVPKT
ncbi:Extradiol ring-cleavage dioxygenase, class III enzyme, subunit B [Colletotrichum navitas]|uniref:Extradiol ring-cleavage dioxygenase, class III enzyme, subunit B n=1 Tax=Colletotrichum navitas TaxID=681940 RepID=A0AAD8PRC5_9PEZI|nr:Extradiol ring-cleavage dioxygenase, class III enzyme, subunit B [Colletotrichum navitas]KAK1574340.1 Extradiol ring-cleavage dioxygenase, class III enzyme, subunit B [Colletotrichum navitas]